MNKINGPGSTHEQIAASSLAGDGLHALCAAVIPVWVEQLRLAQMRSEQAVFDMLQAFSLLTQTEQPKVPHQVATATPWPDIANIDRMYRGFQYQDGLNQMLQLLVNDMERLHAQLGAKNLAEVATEPRDWLDRLRSEYVMQEQRLAGTSAPAAAASHKPDDLTFF